MVDRIVPLQDLWPPEGVDRLFESLSRLDTRRCLSALRDELVARTRRPDRPDTVGQTAPRLIKLYAGQVSIDKMATTYGLSRREFGRRFFAAAGVPPKLFARITRFQALVHALLSTDVSRWASLSPGVGFFDQAHMINEFRAFAGSPPTVFFQPHGGDRAPAKIQLRGRPSEWLRQSGPLGTNESLAGWR
jgi:AraC-like DNA-binding protein